MAKRRRPKKLLTKIRNEFTDPEKDSVRNQSGLSPRQKQVYDLCVVQSLDEQTAADRLGWSYYTISNESVAMNNKVVRLFQMLADEHRDGGNDLRSKTGLRIETLDVNDYLARP